MVTRAASVPFIADPLPQGTGVELGTWAKRQFDALQRVTAVQDVASLEARVAELEAQVSALAAIVGDGTWDGGDP